MSYNIGEIMKNKLGMFDEFEFGCNQCGSCCHRDTLILSGYDLFNIACYKGATTEKILNKYCFGYLGSDSKLPIVSVKPRAYDNSCPFLISKKCSIHQSKPLSCRIFPLGRLLSSEDSKTGHYTYFMQDIKCGNKQRHMVKDWLKKFNIEDMDHDAKAWGQALIDLTKYMQTLSKDKQKIAAQMIIICLYLNYDTNRPYSEQLEENLKDLENMLPGFKRAK